MKCRYCERRACTYVEGCTICNTCEDCSASFGSVGVGHRTLRFLEQSSAVILPLWKPKNSQPAIPGLFEQPITRLAAKNSSSVTSRPANITETSLVSTSHSTTNNLTDEEVFRGIFDKYATGKNSKTYFETASSFLVGGNFGSFQRNAEFLRFLKRTLDYHRYRSPSAFNLSNLRIWFREFQTGIKPEGSKL